MRSIQGWRRRAALTVSAAMLATACGGGAAESPQEALRAALRAMAKDPGITVAVRLETDEASLQALAAAEGQELPPELAALLTSTSLRVSLPLRDDVEAAAVAMVVDGDAVIELRFTGDVLYLRADVPALLDAAGQDPALAEQARGMVAASGLLPAEVVDGRWVALRGAKEAVEQMSGQDLDAGDDAAAEQLRERFTAVLADVSTVEHAGRDADGDRLRASVPLLAVYDALLAEAPQLGLPFAPPPRSQVPDATVAIDFWVDGGRFTAAAFDLRQLADIDAELALPDGVERFAVRADFERFDGVVVAPDDAVELDAEQLLGMFLMGMGGMMMGGEGAMGGMPMPWGSSDMPEADWFEFEDGMPPGEQMSRSAPPASPALVRFYRAAGYGQARQAYCEAVTRIASPRSIEEFYADICPELVGVRT